MLTCAMRGMHTCKNGVHTRCPGCRYLNWLQEAAPSDTHESTLLLERCTRQFLEDERYKHDQRYLKVRHP